MFTFLYISLIEPTTIYPNVVYWDEKIEVNGNKTLDLYNDNQNETIIEEINTSTNYIRTHSNYMLDLIESSNIDSNKLFSIKNSIYESLSKVEEKKL